MSLVVVRKFYVRAFSDGGVRRGNTSWNLRQKRLAIWWRGKWRHIIKREVPIVNNTQSLALGIWSPFLKASAALGMSLLLLISSTDFNLLPNSIHIFSFLNTSILFILVYKPTRFLLMLEFIFWWPPVKFWSM